MLKVLAAAIFFAVLAQAVIGGESVVQGRITARSPLPDPVRSSYPDCYYTLEFQVANLVSGAPTPAKIVIAMPGFMNRKTCAENDFQSGDLLEIQVLPLGEATTKEQEIQQSDTLDRFELCYFLSRKAVRISAYTGSNRSAAKKEFDSVFAGKPLNPPQSERARQARHELIELEKTRISRRLAEFAPKRDAIMQKIAEFIATPHDYPMFGDFWMFKHGKAYLSYSSSNKRFTYRPWIKMSDPTLNALRELKRFFAYHNIDLIVALVPGAYDISGRFLASEFRDYPALTSLETAQKLLENDIEAVEFSDELADRIGDYEWSFFYSTPNDEHPAEGAIDVLSDILAKRLKRYQLTAEFEPDVFSRKIDFAQFCQAGWPLDFDGHKKGDKILTSHII